MANVFLLHLIILLQNVYITMLIYAEGKGSFKKKWVDCGIVSIGQSWERMDILLIMNLKQDFRLLTLFVI